MCSFYFLINKNVRTSEVEMYGRPRLVLKNKGKLEKSFPQVEVKTSN